ncbi:unnamed protein product [Dracunculus medinensis]|uniref:SVWC domain-containing protein n=1 Tax=Dracunculus medinensis TaxID=318479 RepID=A0A0N4UC74_DRAME|nr:unnamed protein product [Dracunculus medinensis]
MVARHSMKRIRTEELNCEYVLPSKNEHMTAAEKSESNAVVRSCDPSKDNCGQTNCYIVQGGYSPQVMQVPPSNVCCMYRYCLY